MNKRVKNYLIVSMVLVVSLCWCALSRTRVLSTREVALFVCNCILGILVGSSFIKQILAAQGRQFPAKHAIHHRLS